MSVSSFSSVTQSPVGALFPLRSSAMHDVTPARRSSFEVPKLNFGEWFPEPTAAPSTPRRTTVNTYPLSPSGSFVGVQNSSMSGRAGTPNRMIERESPVFAASPVFTSQALASRSPRRSRAVYESMTPKRTQTPTAGSHSPGYASVFRQVAATPGAMHKAASFAAPTASYGYPSSTTTGSLVQRMAQRDSHREVDVSTNSSNDVSAESTSSVLVPKASPMRVRAGTPVKYRAMSPVVTRRWDPFAADVEKPLSYTPVKELPLRDAAPTRVNLPYPAPETPTSSKSSTMASSMNRAQTPVSTTSSAGAGDHQTRSARQLLSSFAASWQSKYEENKGNYKDGGYMTVEPGEVLCDRYEIISKLGWGEFSTVWLAHDRNASSLYRCFVAVKVAKCGYTVSVNTKYEIDLLNYLRETRVRGAAVTPLMNRFEHKGTYGSHLCVVLPLHGPNLLCVIDYLKARRRKRTEREMNMIREITVGILKGLQHLESINVIHTDLKPENVLCYAPDKRVVSTISQFLSQRSSQSNEDVVKAVEQGDSCAPIVTIADFGLSYLLEPLNTQNAAARKVGSKTLQVPSPGVAINTGILMQTREYRAPEVLLGADFNCRTDIWSVGCIVYELITGDFLFDPKRKTKVEREMDVEHLMNMMQVLGPVPNRVVKSRARHINRYFDDQGRFLFANKFKSYPRRSIAAELEPFLAPEDAEQAAQFIMSCFTFDPMERLHATDLLKHPWITNTQSKETTAGL